MKLAAVKALTGKLHGGLRLAPGEQPAGRLRRGVQASDGDADSDACLTAVQPLAALTRAAPLVPRQTPREAAADAAVRRDDAGAARRPRGVLCRQPLVNLRRSRRRRRAVLRTNAICTQLSAQWVMTHSWCRARYQGGASCGTHSGSLTWAALPSGHAVSKFIIEEVHNGRKLGAERASSAATCRRRASSSSRASCAAAKSAAAASCLRTASAPLSPSAADRWVVTSSAAPRAVLRSGRCAHAAAADAPRACSTSSPAACQDPYPLA